MPADSNCDFSPRKPFLEEGIGKLMEVDLTLFFLNNRKSDVFKQQSHLIEIILLATSHFFSWDDLSFRWDKTPSERGQKKNQVKLPRSFSREKPSFFHFFDGTDFNKQNTPEV